MHWRLLSLAQILLGILLLITSGAAAEVAKPSADQTAGSASPPAIAVPQTTPAPGAQAPGQPPGPQVNRAQITHRANQEVGLEIERTTADWQQELDRVDNELRRPQLRYTELNSFREELQQVRARIDDFSNRLQPRLDARKAQLEQLGPAPASGQPPEPEQVALQRAELTYHVGLLSAGQAAVNSSRARIDNLINTIQDIRRKNFTSNLFQPIPGVYSYDTWANLPEHVPLAVNRIGQLITDWWNSARDHEEIKRSGLEALLLCLLLTLVGWRGVRRLRTWQHPAEPPFWRRASSAAGLILFRAAPTVVPVIFLYVSVANSQALPERIDWLFYIATQSVIIVFTVNALTTTVFAPTLPRWRLIAASDQAAARICALALLLAVVYGVMNLAYVATRLVQAPFALTMAVALPSSLLLVGIVIGILLTPLEGDHQDRPSSLRWLRALRMPVWAIIAAIVASALSGYLALARFLTQQLIVTGSILALVYLLLLWVDGFAQALTEGAVLGRWLEEKAGLDHKRREQIALPLGLLLKCGVLLVSVPLIMLQWGYTWPDIRDWYGQLFFGFHIANTQVSFAALLASIIVFALGYGAARLFQRWLDAQVLKPAGISGGVRDSIGTAVGYVGIVIAGLIAFSYAGFNLSNLAIVAGAFSIGIGFGLQSLVNNFVSGLILLAERPIKVGDLVVVGGEEGYVRKISVRSTEVETFDKAHVLIPNSYLVAEKVKNWTLRNNIRRLAIGVGVAYGCDAREVQNILLKVAKDNPDVLSLPEPFVDFEEFGATSLSFKLYVYIADLTKTVRTRTELRIAILEAFDRAGVVIASGPTDVTIRNLGALRDAIAGELSHPQVAASSGNGHAAPDDDGGRAVAEIQLRHADPGAPGQLKPG
jgi:potassium-dependent mechanosensitive channel